MTRVTATEIAKALGVPAPTVRGWIARRPDFPRPVGRMANARVWDLDEVREWHRTVDLSAGRPRS